jgi:hypothetical protein
MSLSADLISQFAKTTKDKETGKKETTVYGTIVTESGTQYVRLDGSTELTPYVSTVEASSGDVVAVMLKNHTATVIGNITSPSVKTETVQIVVNDVKKVEKIVADVITTEELSSVIGRISDLETYNVTVNNLLTANSAAIETLKVDKLSAADIAGKYANIDFSNIDKATMASFYAKSGLIQNVIVGDATISGKLVGVTIDGDLIEANTLVANKLVIQGEDGLYYKLNTDGIKTEAEQTDYNSLNGDVIKAKSIAATKINVTDLVAFNATIGGFNITDTSLYSGVKETVDNTTRGIYLDNTGQISLGDASNYLKYYKDSDGSYKLAISAESMTFSTTGKNIQDTIQDAVGGRNYIAKTIFGSAKEHKIYNASYGTLERTEDGLKVTCTSDTSRNGFILPLTFDGCLENGQKYTLSFKYRTNLTNTGTIYVLQRTTPNVNVSGGTTLIASSTEWQSFRITFSSAEINARVCYAILIPYMYGNGNWIEIKDRSVKLEKGTKATTWVPALEDGVTMATSYMNLSSEGLIVGQNPGSPTAGNTLISADGVSIRKGTTTLAAFKAATRTASGISSATLTSSDSTDSESDGTTRVSGTITSGGTRANVYITTNGNPVYFQNGLETNKVLINDASGIISNANIILNASLVDKSGEGILTPLNSYGNMVIGYGRYQDGGGTYVYGTLVKAKTKNGFSATVNGVPAIDTNNDSGNATFGWHLYEAGTGETNIYGQITSLFSKGDMRLNAEGNNIRFNGDLVPYSGNAFNIGAASLAVRDIHINRNNDGTIHGLKFSNSSVSTNAVGINAKGYPIFGNDEYCTNIITKSTTTSSTGYSFKITCGDNPALTVDDNDARLFLYGGTDSTSRYLGSMAVYKRTYSNASNVYITDKGMMGRSTSSSERYKKDIVDLDFDVVKTLYDLPVRQFKYRTEYISADDERYERDIPGFIAEEVDEYLPIACDHIPDADGNLVPEMWNSQIIIPSLLKLIQDLNSRLKSLEERS